MSKSETKKPDFDRLDDVDIYVQSAPWTTEERNRFSEFLKKRREKEAKAKSRSNKSRKTAKAKA